VPAPEHLGAETLAQSLRPHLLQVSGRHASGGGEVELSLALVSGEDPGRLELHALEDFFEGDLLDGLGVLFPVHARGDLREDQELALPPSHDVP
jgi:hypothetical protein